MTLLSHGTDSRSLFSYYAALLLLALLALVATPANAQQTGDISGQVTDAGGNPIAGVEIRASSNVLPQPRVVTSASNGQYRLRRLPPRRLPQAAEPAGLSLVGPLLHRARRGEPGQPA